MQKNVQSCELKKFCEELNNCKVAHFYLVHGVESLGYIFVADSIDLSSFKFSQ